jgi:hypothetical protein
MDDPEGTSMRFPPDVNGVLPACSAKDRLEIALHVGTIEKPSAPAKADSAKHTSKKHIDIIFM